MKKLTALLVLALALTLSLCIASADTVAVTLSDEGTAAVTGVTVEGSVVTITKPGDYVVSGTLSNGCLKVDSTVTGKITVYLNGVNIHNETGSAILIGKCDPRCTISLMEGSVNELSSGDSLVYEKDDEPNAVIFSHSDLTIAGEGTLNITAGPVDGIASKDDLRIKSGTITVNVTRHGIRGKDCVEISGGKLSIVAGKDGIRSTNTKVNDAGYITISGGELQIVCGDEPLSAVTGINVEGGTIRCTIKKTAKEEK